MQVKYEKDPRGIVLKHFKQFFVSLGNVCVPFPSFPLPAVKVSCFSVAVPAF